MRNKQEAVFLSRSAEETEKIAENFAVTLVAGDVIALSGGLGAGKTAFTRGLARGLGSRDVVSSPSYALTHVYSGTRHDLVHFDLYRLAPDGCAVPQETLENIGLYAYLEEDCVCAVEWSERAGTAMPLRTIHVYISPGGNTQERRIRIVYPAY
jgi:tRNA threonylcarbamoyladenosine biosynthesis protein TsaE